MGMPRTKPVVLSVLICACKNPGHQDEPENIIPPPREIGARTTNAQVRLLQGIEVGHLSRALRGKGTVVNVWATWCNSCKGELPAMQWLASHYGPSALNVALVSVDEPEAYDRLPAWLKTFGFGQPIWVAARPLGEFKWELAKSWKGNIPITLLFDNQGRRRFFWDGPVALAEITPILEDFLAGKVVDGERHYALSAGTTE